MSVEWFLLPAIALMCWTMVMRLWLYFSRIPAMKQARIHPNKARHPSADWQAKMPAVARSVADNYNHLHEQPTLFYALMIMIALLGQQDMLGLTLAWLYVATRVVHSLVQVLAANVVPRFFAFAISSVVLFGLLLRTAAVMLTAG